MFMRMSAVGQPCSGACWWCLPRKIGSIEIRMQAAPDMHEKGVVSELAQITGLKE